MRAFSYFHGFLLLLLLSGGGRQYGVGEGLTEGQVPGGIGMEGVGVQVPRDRNGRGAEG